MKMKKKGIELSINFLVILILSIVVFGFGISFLARIAKVATEMELPSEEKFYLEACLNEGKSVCIGTNRRVAKIKETIILGLGISNTIGKDTFSVYNEFKRAVLDDDSSFDSDSIEDNKVPDTLEGPKEVLIEKNENHNALLSYVVPLGTKAGEYVYDAYVCMDGTAENERDPCEKHGAKVYGGLHKVYIEVI